VLDRSASTEVTPARGAQAADLPSLTVVTVTIDCYETLRTTIRHLAVQTIHQRIELLICAPSRGELQLDEQEMQPFHSFRIFESGHGGTIVAAKVPAVHAARAPVVIFAEDHSFPEPTWAEQLVDAHAHRAVAAGPQIRNASPQSMMSWADLFLGFGPRVEPLPHGPIARLPWHNSAYDREVLVSLGDELEAMIENEGLLHERLCAEGKQMYIAREENHTSRLFRVPFKREVTPGDSLKTFVPNRPIPSVRLTGSASQLLPTLPRTVLRRPRGKVNGRYVGKRTVVSGCFLSRQVGRDGGDRTLALGNETQCRGKQFVGSASRTRL
jgi:hypothetical protein